MNKYKELITYLDCALTNKPYKDCLHTFSNSYANNEEEFICGELYYLSDGGYSRLSYNDEYERVLLHSSSFEIKNRCLDSHYLMSDLNQHLIKYIKENN